MPVQVEGEADGGNAQLPALEDDEHMDALIQTLGNLIHDIGLCAQQGVHLTQALLLGFDLKLGAEGVELFEVELHLMPKYLRT